MSTEYTEQQFRETMQPILVDELMQSWRKGVKTGLTMAHSMAEAVRNEVARHSDGSPESEAQIAVLGGLMSSLLQAVEDPLITSATAASPTTDSTHP